MLPPVPHAVTIRVLCNSLGQETSFPYLLSNYGNTLEKHGTVNHHSVALRRKTNKQPIADTGKVNKPTEFRAAKIMSRISMNPITLYKFQHAG